MSSIEHTILTIGIRVCFDPCLYQISLFVAAVAFAEQQKEQGVRRVLLVPSREVSFLVGILGIMTQTAQDPPPSPLDPAHAGVISRPARLETPPPRVARGSVARPVRGTATAFPGALQQARSGYEEA